MIEFEVVPGGQRIPGAERKAVLLSPGFGRFFTDHMITLRWTDGRGWHDGRLEPYGPLPLDPATSAFHYGQEFFEGMKAYHQANGSVALFRPRANAARFNSSARRLVMPELPAEDFTRALELLVTQDRDWVPPGDGDALYLRPFMIATQRGLGFSLPSSTYLFCAIASPVSAYFGGGTPRPVAVWLSREYTRAAPGGTGAVKATANYAQAFAAQQQATANGCDQVVWLDATEHAWVEEMGGMNLFFVYGGRRPRVMTPALTGTLLPGVTRDSLLRLAPRLGIGASEGRLSVSQWRRQCESGELTEVFACGTAAVVSPVGKVKGEDCEWLVGDGNPGPVTMRLREELLGLQYGRIPDPFDWMHKVC